MCGLGGGDETCISRESAGLELGTAASTTPTIASGVPGGRSVSCNTQITHPPQTSSPTPSRIVASKFHFPSTVTRFPLGHAIRKGECFSRVLGRSIVDHISQRRERRKDAHRGCFIPRHFLGYQRHRNGRQPIDTRYYKIKKDGCWGLCSLLGGDFLARIICFVPPTRRGRVGRRAKWVSDDAQLGWPRFRSRVVRSSARTDAGIWAGEPNGVVDSEARDVDRAKVLRARSTICRCSSSTRQMHVVQGTYGRSRGGRSTNLRTSGTEASPWVGGEGGPGRDGGGKGRRR